MEYQQHVCPPSSDLRTAEMRDLRDGVPLYLNDPRRTPVKVLGIDPATASFFLRVEAFEDEGAEWAFALWEVGKFLVPPDKPQLTMDAVDALTVNVEKLNRRVEILCEEATTQQTLREIADRADALRLACQKQGWGLPTDAKALLDRETSHPKWVAALAGILEAEGLALIEETFAKEYVSNPNASEMIKAHRIVLAQLGLCPYRGEPLRDPKWLQPPFDSKSRSQHIFTRLAFMRMAFGQAGLDRVPLFRAVYSDKAISPPRNRGFVSSTFSEEVATALLESARQAYFKQLLSQDVPAVRLFMTFLETPQLTEKYQEAEAVLIFEPGNGVF